MKTPITRPWSCDTFVAGQDATASGRLLFGKNSDRPAGEAQPLRKVPAREGKGDLNLAYVTIPDEPGYAHLGSAPFWCWGYEFGVNEHGVTIGNEAQFTRSWSQNVEAAKAGNPPQAGILGMELVRLGLERAATAVEAVTVVTDLLERYGQWGSGLFGKDPVEGAYDNSFLIADASDAWVVETSGREWVSRRVHSGVYSISNEPSIRSDYDACSRNLLAVSYRNGWSPAEEIFDYAASHVDPMTPLQLSHIRQRRSLALLEDARATNGVDVQSAKRVLRDHLEGSFLAGPYFNAARPDFLTLCMHEHEAGFTWGNTAASIIVDHAKTEDGLTVIWWTPLPPCTGAYVPLFLEAGNLPATLTMPERPLGMRAPEEFAQAPFDPMAYWWRFQNLLDAVKGDASGSKFLHRQPLVRARFDSLEAEWEADVDRLRRAWDDPDAERSALVAELNSLTSRAVAQADAEVVALMRAFAPEAGARALDPRWEAAAVPG